MIIDVSILVALAQPPNGPDESASDATVDVEAPELDESNPQTPPTTQNAVPDRPNDTDKLDNVEFADAAPKPQSELEWQDEATPPPNLPFASESPRPPEFEYASGKRIDSAPDTTPNVDAHLHRTSSTTNGTPQRFGLSFKAGPYLPNVDRGRDNGPYAKVFGSMDDSGAVVRAPKAEPSFWLGFEWQFAHFAGPLSVGLDVGWFRDKAPAPIAMTPSQKSGADENRFGIVPLTALVGYRFALLADKTYIPLVPYARAGLSYSFWWTKTGDADTVKTDSGEKVRGGVLGWQAVGGLSLRLDGIVPRAGRDLDRSYGINHVSLFGEYLVSQTGFGSKKQINLGDLTWLAGIIFEF